MAYVEAVLDKVLEQQRVEADYDRIVREDIELFRQAAEAYTARQITDDQFRAQRLRRGVYGQRQEGVQMVRTKVPGGKLTARQLEQLALIADKYGHGRGHLTTRQNVQFHFIPLADVPTILHLLADVRLTTREACYNTVRNVTACPTAGLRHDDVFDVTPYAQRTAFTFLHRELTDNMPRKFKIAFCGCASDCMVGAIHDVGARAVIREEHGENKRGFRLVIGGGLGPLPCEARLLDEFLPEEQLIPRIEAILRVFNAHGNRNNKNKARFKFVIRERGFDWVKAQIERAYADIVEHGGIAPAEEVPDGFGGFELNPQALGSGALLPIVQPNSAPDPAFDRWLETNVAGQKQDGYALVDVRVDQGNLTGNQMRGLARISREAGDGLIRFTIDQNVVLAFIPVANLRRVYSALSDLGLASTGVHEIEDVTTCPGAWTCNLGLTKSMTLGAALQGAVASYGDPEIRKLTIKISGCPNSCGQHWIADLGFYGNSRKIDGKEVPYYQMLLGGGYDGGGMMRFGLAISSIPARLAPAAVTRILDHYRASRLAGETFREYVMRHKVEHFRAMVADLIKPAEPFPDLFKDWGDEADFSLKLGRGECAA
ncbi:MAG: nitrite/sulfite reductase [Acidobacteria bacterium]|nr:nitrite/sulfite reductase [Acidobacteriota bacterium]MBI3281971.1 nitrite/sulfite reductase [Acidobacteriota bacterium]